MSAKRLRVASKVLWVSCSLAKTVDVEFERSSLVDRISFIKLLGERRLTNSIFVMRTGRFVRIDAV